MSKITDRFELLAPAGDEECLRAAVANGADAVYFGLEEFNARRRATNFTLAGLPDTMAYLHGHNVKGYVAFNTLVFTDELERAADCLRQIIEAGADALIVQDLGIASLIRRMSRTFPIHASTQTSQTHAAGMGVLRDLGISRVVLARELSLAEIRRVADETDLELEAFVHGALCVSYSGQCLASESLWGRSGNRGLCAQACRLPYQLIVDGREQPQPSGDYLLSPHDLAAYSRIAELMQAGVTSFKIEGRLKGVQYVSSVVRVYREAIDAAMQGRAYVLAPEREAELAQSFSRGSTCGFLDGPRHQEYIGARSPKSRGFRIGSVVERSARGIVVRIDSASRTGQPVVKPGDGVVFENVGCDEPEQGGRVYSVQAWKGSAARQHSRCEPDSLFELTFGRNDLDLRKVAIGSVVFKSDDPAIGRRLESNSRRDQVARPVAVSARVMAELGKPLCVVLADAHGHAVQVCSDEPLAVAERHPLTAALLREQLSRLGDTPFQLESLELIGPDGPADSVPLMAPKSVLNQLRRAAVQKLLEVRASGGRHAVDASDALDRFRRESAHREVAVESALPRKLHVLVRDLEQLDAVLDLRGAVVNLGTIYADLPEKKAFAEAVRRGRDAGVSLGLATPQIIHPGQEHLLNAIAEAGPDVVLVRSLTALELLRQRLPGASMVGDFSLNLANELTAAVLADRGLTRLTLGYDLNVTQINSLLGQAAGMDFELIVHAHVPMFLTAHCPAAAMLSVGNSCRDCGRPCVKHRLHLRDRKGEHHPLRADAAGRSTLFSSIPQSVVPVWSRVAQLPLRHWRVELLEENPAEARERVALHARLAAGDKNALAELRQKNTRARAGSLEHA